MHQLQMTADGWIDRTPYFGVQSRQHTNPSVVSSVQQRSSIMNILKIGYGGKSAITKRRVSHIPPAFNTAKKQWMEAILK
jgi:hypothetical protein